MLRPLPILVLLALALPLSAQDAPPSGLAALEAERSRTCVDVLTRLEALDVQLEPLAMRGERLLGMAGAIRVEEMDIVDSLDTSDPLEAAVVQWFRADAALAERYITAPSQVLLDERAAAKRAIQARVTEALQAVDAQGDSIVAPTGTLRSDGVTCSGAILVRGPAVAGCEGLTSRVCDAARDSTLAAPFAFVESADMLWYRQELRPWTAPAPLQVTPEGQLTGVRTVGASRTGNVAVSLAFNPILRTRAELTAEDLATIDSINGPLGIDNSHPEVAFAPSLAIQATLPRALGEETAYVLHFGSPAEPDILWTGEANTGSVIVGTAILAVDHVERLRAGDPISITAVRENADGEVEMVYTMELTSLNQAARVEALLGYMTRQLSADLARVIQPTN